MSFDSLHLLPEILRALAKEGYLAPTAIQTQAIPVLLQGRDVMGIAQTGTGKTAAFAIPILQRMAERPKRPAPRRPRVLVLTPTRELAAQISESFATYGQFLPFRNAVVFGGVGQGPQVHALTRGVDVLVATPGRLLDLMAQGHADLGNVEFFVLDEADRMLDMGFINDVKRVVSRLPAARQTLCFSATMPREVAELARRMLKDPVQVHVTPQASTVETVQQFVFFVNAEKKDELLLSLFKEKHLTRTLIFTRTKNRANKVARMLSGNRIFADAIHGNKSQNQRTYALSNFKAGRIKVLVATDIAARGIDIEAISHVINYDLPNVPETYVHRIGRTARAGAEGTAYSFCAADERDFLRDIERITRQKIPVMDHQFHSEHAKNATGSAARPLPRVSHGFRGNSHFGNRGGFRR